MHQGQIPGHSASSDPTFNSQQGASQQHSRALGGSPNGKLDVANVPSDFTQAGGNADAQTNLSISANSVSLDDLLSGAAKDADRASVLASAKADSKTDEPNDEKKGRKDKDKNTRLVYSDNDISPEEKMAQLPRYAFTPKGTDSIIAGGAATTASIAIGLEA